MSDLDLLAGGLSQTAVRVWLGLQASQALLEKDALPCAHSRECRRRSAPSWPWARSHTQLLATWASPQDSSRYGSLLHQMEEEPERAKEY